MNTLKEFVPPILLSPIKKFLGRTGEKNIERYIKNGRVPWSIGYGAYKDRYISEMLEDTGVLEGFLDSLHTQRSLTSGYGYGLDERCVEYPWLLANLPDSASKILDAGSALNHAHILGCTSLRTRELHFVTLSPEDKCFWKKGFSYIYSDLRYLPLKSEFYDVVTCISTLEHIGFDNRIYVKDNSAKEEAPRSFISAIKEMYRVLKKGGQLFLTIPYGLYRNYGTFQQFDSHLITLVREIFSQDVTIFETYFRYNEDGWQFSNARDCDNSLYSNLTVELWEKMSSDRNVDMSLGSGSEHDLAAAARSVACLRVIKVS